MTKHQTNCESPICMDDKNPDTVWCWGESICKRTPISEVQKRQKRINAEPRLKDKSWTLKELLNSSL